MNKILIKKTHPHPHGINIAFTCLDASAITSQVTGELLSNTTSKDAMGENATQKLFALK